MLSNVAEMHAEIDLDHSSVRPDLIQKILSIYNLVGVHNQDAKDLHRPAAQRSRYAVRHWDIAVRNEFKRSEDVPVVESAHGHFPIYLLRLSLRDRESEPFVKSCD